MVGEGRISRETQLLAEFASQNRCVNLWHDYRVRHKQRTEIMNCITAVHTLCPRTFLKLRLPAGGRLPKHYISCSLLQIANHRGRPSDTSRSESSTPTWTSVWTRPSEGAERGIWVVARARGGIERRRAGSRRFEPSRMAAIMPTSEIDLGNAGGADMQSGERSRVRVGAVFFDMDDTLVLTHEVDTAAQLVVMDLVAVRAPHVDRPAVLREFQKQFQSIAWDPEHKVEVHEWRARLWGHALKTQGVKDMDLARDMQKCFNKERLQAFRWTTSVEELVRSLHRQGIKVGVITNGHKEVQRAKLKACNAHEMFDTILVGGEEPKEKPHRDIFLKACKLAGCRPEESIMVGDTLKTDIQGGINAGFLSTVWVNVHKSERAPGTPQPDHEIATFAELRRVLEGLGVAFDAS